MHAPLPPSSADRIVACPGSAKMEAMYPQEETIDTREGHAAHWAGSEVLNLGLIAVGQVAENGVVLNVEMVEAAEAYAGYIFNRDGPLVHEASVERTIRSAAIRPENYGTPDYWLYVADAHHLFVDDFKYGRGFVNEFGNYQLINYTALIAKHLGLYHDDSLRVTMTIHQPRCFHRRGPVRAWTTTLGELRRPIMELSAAFTMAMSDDPPCIARDPEACRNCSARFDCEANMMAVGPAVDLAWSSTPLRLTNAAMSRELRTLRRAEKMIKSRREGLEQAAKSIIQRGGLVPYFGIEHTKGRIVWKDDAIDQGIIDVAKAMGAKIEKPGLITPLQAIKAGIPEDVVTLYSHAPGGAAELVEDDGTAAANIFSKE